MNIPDNPSESFKRINPHIFVVGSATPAHGGMAFGAPTSELPKPPSIDLSSRPSKDESKLNKTEAAYLAHLRMLKVPLLRIQQHTLKLADDCRFTPDFSYVDANGRGVFVDVKGFQREDALIKAKFAARLFNEYRFIIAKRKKGGGWDEQEVNP